MRKVNPLVQRNTYICKQYRTRTRSLRSLADELGISHSQVRSVLLARNVRMNNRGARFLKRAA
jgi:predicted ArsR family transcriptional regulator